MGLSNDTPETPARPSQTSQADSHANSAGDKSPGGLTPNLALIRTDLANERTLLAYGRTALMLVATGVSLVKFLNLTAELVVLGWFLIATGAIVGAIGTFRFTSLRHRLNTVRKNDAPNHPPAP